MSARFRKCELKIDVRKKEETKLTWVLVRSVGFMVFADHNTRECCVVRVVLCCVSMSPTRRRNLLFKFNALKILFTNTLRVMI